VAVVCICRKVFNTAIEVGPRLPVRCAPLVGLVLDTVVPVGVHPTLRVVLATKRTCGRRGGRRRHRRRCPRLPVKPAPTASAARRQRCVAVAPEAGEVFHSADEVGPRLPVRRAPLVAFVARAVVPVGVHPCYGVVGATLRSHGRRCGGGVAVLRAAGVGVGVGVGVNRLVLLPAATDATSRQRCLPTVAVCREVVDSAAEVGSWLTVGRAPFAQRIHGTIVAIPIDPTTRLVGACPRWRRRRSNIATSPAATACAASC